MELKFFGKQRLRLVRKKEKKNKTKSKKRKIDNCLKAVCKAKKRRNQKASFFSLIATFLVLFLAHYLFYQKKKTEANAAYHIENVRNKFNSSFFFFHFLIFWSYSSLHLTQKKKWLCFISVCFLYHLLIWFCCSHHFCHLIVLHCQ